MKSKFELLSEYFIIFLVLLAHLYGFMNFNSQNINAISDGLLEEQILEYKRNFSNLAPKIEPKKVLMMVIDGLREDHIFSEDKTLMPYVQQCINNQSALRYHIKTNAPTVTLPRLKSLVTGTVTGFMDIILNFASDELKEDHLIRLWREKGLKLHFYGDDTWLKLFPNLFHHSDGVSSFYVSDYTEVDNNVTRHLTEELLGSPWNVLVLHYLGLDHIGHLQGPNGSLMGPKLLEMDSIVKKIHKSLKTKKEPYLFVVTGDHGMADRGGHGGASHSEIWTSALAMSDVLDKSTDTSHSLKQEYHLNQVDLASTLALMSGTTIPKRNIGRPFFNLISKLPLKQQLFFHYVTAKQLASVISANYSPERESILQMFTQVMTLHRTLAKDWHDPPSSKLRATVDHLLNTYDRYEMLVSSVLLDMVQSYDILLLFSSSFLLVNISILSLGSSTFLSAKSSCSLKKYWAAVWVLGICLFYLMRFIAASFLILPSLYVAMQWHRFYSSCVIKQNVWYFDDSIIQKAIFIGAIFQPCTLLATSLVEEEHFTFYFAISTIYFLLFYGFLQSFLRSLYPAVGRTPEKEYIQVLEPSFLEVSNEISYLPSLFTMHIYLWKLFDSFWKTAFHYQLYDKAKNKSIFMKFIPNLAIVYASSCLFRLCRSFNATGDKWRDVTHFNDIIKHSDLLQMTVLLGVFIVFCLYYKYGLVLVFLSLLGIIGRHYPIIDTEHYGGKGLFEAHWAYLFIGLLLIFGFIKVFWIGCVKKVTFEADELHKINVCLLFFQYVEVFLALVYLIVQNPENILLTSLLFLHFHLILPVLVRNRRDFGLGNWHLYVIVYWIANAHFFMEGNNNNLSTVNMNAGFVGVTFYNPFIHGFLITVHTFASRFLVFLHFLIVYLSHEKNIRCVTEVLWSWWSIQLLTLTLYVINVTLQRYHLFIWSVFAPKLLYEESHFLCLIVLSLIALGGSHYSEVSKWFSNKS